MGKRDKSEVSDQHKHNTIYKTGKQQGPTVVARGTIFNIL